MSRLNGRKIVGLKATEKYYLEKQREEFAKQMKELTDTIGKAKAEWMDKCSEKVYPPELVVKVKARDESCYEEVRKIAQEQNIRLETMPDKETGLETTYFKHGDKVIGGFCFDGKTIRQFVVKDKETNDNNPS